MIDKIDSLIDIITAFFAANGKTIFIFSKMIVASFIYATIAIASVIILVFIFSKLWPKRFSLEYWGIKPKKTKINKQKSK